jgi:hypothetical protein
VKQPAVLKFAVEKDAIGAVCTQLRKSADKLLRSDKTQEEDLVLFDKLTHAAISLVYGNPENQDKLRDTSLFASMFDFLDKAATAGIESSKVFNEGTVISILNLLVNATDTNKGNQQHILRTFKKIDLSKDQF